MGQEPKSTTGAMDSVATSLTVAMASFRTPGAKALEGSRNGLPLIESEQW